MSARLPPARLLLSRLHANCWRAHAWSGIDHSSGSRPWPHRDRLMLTADRNPGKAILDRDGIAIAATGLLLLALAAALLIPQDQAEMLRTFTPEHIEMLGMFDSRAQQRAHRLLVVLLAILGIAALLTRRRRVKLTVPRAVVSCVHLVRENAGIGVLAGVAVCFMLYRGTQPATSYAIVQGAYYPLALLPSALSQLLAMAGGTLAVMAYCWTMRQPAIGARAGALKLASMLALAVYAFTLCVATFAIPPDLREFPFHAADDRRAAAATAAGRVRAHRFSRGFRRAGGSARAVASSVPAVRCTRYAFPGLGSASTVL